MFLVSIPTSSAVIYLPLNECTNSPNLRINSGVFCVLASPIITALPPPILSPVMADLNVIPLERRKTSFKASHSVL
ncbi:hypothetical protein D9M71_621820 [compost metagenome]